MKKVAFMILVSMLASAASWAYDTALARSYEQLFMAASGKATPKALHFIKTPDFVGAVKKGEELFVLDIRTPNEMGILGMTIPGSVAIPLDQVFKPENLARIPTDKKVVIICKSGQRALAAGMALRHVGFENVYVLKKGIIDLAKYLSPKTAY